jgi:hypothetical protein
MHVVKVSVVLGCVVKGKHIMTFNGALAARLRFKCIDIFSFYKRKDMVADNIQNNVLLVSVV